MLRELNDGIIARLTRIAGSLGYNVDPDSDGWMEVFHNDDDTIIIAYHCDCLHYGKKFVLGLDGHAVGDKEFSVWDKTLSEESDWMFITDIDRDIFTQPTDIRLETAINLLEDIQMNGFSSPGSLSQIDIALKSLYRADVFRMEEHRLGLFTELEMLIENGVITEELSWYDKMRVIDEMINDNDLAGAQDSAFVCAVDTVKRTIE